MPKRRALWASEEKKGSGLEISALIIDISKLTVEKLCIKCGYQRKPGDTAPETECSHCGALIPLRDDKDVCKMLQYKAAFRRSIYSWTADRCGIVCE